MFSNLQIPNHDTFYSIQRTLILPAINEHYEQNIKESHAQISGVDEVILGDGRFDSPGKLAKYCTYSFQSASTKKVIASSTIQTISGKGSAPLEMKGFITCLTELESANISISTVATDRNKQVAKWVEMKGFITCLTDLESANISISTVATDRNKVAKWVRNERKAMKHKYDPWHFVKNVKSKLRLLAKKKTCRLLGEWIKPVANHLFWCAENCDGDAEKLSEMWISVLHHVTNRHKFSKPFNKYRMCAHKKYTQAEASKKKWMKKDSPPYNALEKVVLHKRILADLPHLARPYHTGSVEVFNSVVNMYAPK